MKNLSSAICVLALGASSLLAFGQDTSKIEDR
jgi:hypothetical protein